MSFVHYNQAELLLDLYPYSINHIWQTKYPTKSGSHATATGHSHMCCDVLWPNYWSAVWNLVTAFWKLVFKIKAVENTNAKTVRDVNQQMVASKPGSSPKTGRNPGRFDHVPRDVACMVLCVVLIIKLLPTQSDLSNAQHCKMPDHCCWDLRIGCFTFQAIYLQATISLASTKA